MSRYLPPARLSQDETRLVLDLLAARIPHMPASDPGLGAALSAYGKLSEGDNMTVAESAAAFGPYWYVSQTGRKLKNKPESHVPITPRRYVEAEAAAIHARGMRLRNRRAA